MMMVIIVEVLSFLPKIKTEKMRAVKKVWGNNVRRKTCPSGLCGIKVWFEAIEVENDEGG